MRNRQMHWRPEKSIIRRYKMLAKIHQITA
jgi:hypothetical protein